MKSTSVQESLGTDSADESLLSTGSILAIDDDGVTVGILKDLLEMSGYTVFTANEGREGINVFGHTRPDLVITDIQMPHMDGLEVLAKVREIDNTVSVVLLTGHGDLDNALRALRRGAHDFLLKPVNTDILLNTVRRGIDHCRLKRFERNYKRLLEEEVKARTQELARTNDFLKSILDSSTGVSIVLTGFDEQVLFWNRGAERIFGYTEEEMIGNSITKLYPDETVDPETIARLNNIMQNVQGTAHANVRHIAKDGRTLTISLTVTPVVDSNGDLRGILGLGQDVTEQVRLHEELLKSFQRIKKIQGASIFSLAKLAESRDGETGFHLKRIQAYCDALCRRLSKRERYKEVLTPEFIEDLVQCSVLHDIGKVAIPDAILFNPKKFGIDEYELMKQHAMYGGKALEEAAAEADEPDGYLSLAKDVAYYHHERWDGSGYPFGLKGEEIPLAARIVAVIDVYDALITERRYKRSYTHEEARTVIVQGKGTQFDPELVEVFLEIEDEFQRIRDKVSGQDSALELAG
ncbi:response regulator [Desulfomonile tiedjei]|uniref:PAS domain S-box n=1 Tax=Desulfomonile tiedjei (strain ATCC 49306 / DSM 6799 / DCB-1) TaxID=706587 RepID=I4C666_DESTA|nr:response regulator [Desulfomonile tiedjei]AFM25057.1 PAS domain S-box [Desulfomonile tiedjei DSM 6799]